MSIANRPDLILGIDPDVKMSGVACIDLAEGTVASRLLRSVLLPKYGKAGTAR